MIFNLLRIGTPARGAGDGRDIELQLPPQDPEPAVHDRPVFFLNRLRLSFLGVKNNGLLPAPAHQPWFFALLQCLDFF